MTDRSVSHTTFVLERRYPAAPGRVFAAWASGPTDVWAVGTGGTILHFDGTTFAPVASGTSHMLIDVWCNASDDVWAVGAVLYHLLSGRAPFEGENEVKTLQLNGRNFIQLIALAPGVSNQTGQDEAHASSSVPGG